MDLSNAKIVAWGTINDRRTVVGVRDSPSDLAFRTTSQNLITLTTLSKNKGLDIRILEEFPTPTLEEVVGDAWAFLYHEKGWPNRPMAAVFDGDSWQYTRGASCPPTRTLAEFEALHRVDLSTVVPLYPKERDKG